MSGATADEDDVELTARWNRRVIEELLKLVWIQKYFKQDVEDLVRRTT
jgi:hypothetical protein